MNRYTNQTLWSLQFINNIKYYKNRNSDYDDEYSSSQRSSRNHSDEDHEYSSRRGRWEPSYFNRNTTRKKIVDPNDSSRWVFNFFKRVSEVLLIITGLGFCIASIGYILIGALSANQLEIVNQNYFADVVGISWIFGSIAGIITGIFFLILYILMIVNRRGWLRKNPFKTYCVWFIAFIVVTFLSIYFLFVACSQIWLHEGKISLSYQNNNINNVISNVSSVVITLNTWKYLENIINAFYNNSINIIGTGVVFLAIDFIILLFGGLYFRFVNQVLEKSYDYFDNRRREW